MSSVQYTQANSLIQKSQTGDLIATLPVDQSPPTNHELQIVNTLFTKHKGSMNLFIDEAKDSLLIGVLFIVFSLPLVDKLITKFVPVTEKSPYLSLIVKAAIVMALYWLIKHFYLSRKN